jgi:hypothetical protein
MHLIYTPPQFSSGLCFSLAPFNTRRISSIFSLDTFLISYCNPRIISLRTVVRMYPACIVRSSNPFIHAWPSKGTSTPCAMNRKIPKMRLAWSNCSKSLDKFPYSDTSDWSQIFGVKDNVAHKDTKVEYLGSDSQI